MTNCEQQRNRQNATSTHIIHAEHSNEWPRNIGVPGRLMLPGKI